MIKEIIQAVQAKIQSVTDIKYVDADWGQLDYYSPNFPVKFPCALIDVSNANYSNIGIDKRATPRNRQQADATLSLTIADLKLSNSSGMAPTFQKDNAYKIYELIESVHAMLQGFCATNKTTALIRTGMSRSKRDDGVQEYYITYSFSIHNI